MNVASPRRAYLSNESGSGASRGALTSPGGPRGKPVARHARNPPTTSVARRNPSACRLAAASEEA